MSKIIVGKYALESLTTGMYSDPFVVFREYIQNAADSIDAAYNEGCLIPGQEHIRISIFPNEGRIEIYDNGLGISSSTAELVLTGIGNSNKSRATSRGFRGIGRLAGLSFCKTLIFETSFWREPVKSKLIIDAEHLSESINIPNQDEVQAASVFNNVCRFDQEEGNENEHFFRVILSGISLGSDLLKITEIQSYLEQVSPVPFKDDGFTWGKEINSRIQRLGYKIPQYNIVLQSPTSIRKIFKPYSDSFVIDQVHGKQDNIQDIETFVVIGENNTNMAIGWIAHTSYFGTVSERKIRGLRLRSGNILIGDGQSLNTIFKDARFNGWVIGEVYAIDSRLIPNARRDNFEKNALYFLLLEKLTVVAREITKNIRSISLRRNEALQSAVQKSEEITKKAGQLLNREQFKIQDKSVISAGLQKSKGQLLSINASSDVERVFHEIAFDELDMLIGKIQGSTQFKALNLCEGINKAEKKTLEHVFIILQKHLSQNQMDEVTADILKQFS